jgi:hypothetical protein
MLVRTGGRDGNRPGLETAQDAIGEDIAAIKPRRIA